MKLALTRFGLIDENIDNFVMTTVLVDKAIIDRKLQSEERPFSLIPSIAKVRYAHVPSIYSLYPLGEKYIQYMQDWKKNHLRLAHCQK